jgi:hypothetical protein
MKIEKIPNAGVKSSINESNAMNRGVYDVV